MKSLISALQFLTIIPLRGSDNFDPLRILPLFPVAGLFIGFILASVDFIAGSFLSTQAGSVVDVVFLVIITGALHLDGVGDAADGLYGHRPKEKALAIMKDSRIGAMGMIAVACVLALKWAGIMDIHTHRFLLLAIVPSYSRGSMLFGFRFLEYGRPGGGTGQAFFSQKPGIRAFIWLILPVGLSFLSGANFLWINLWFGLIVCFILMFYKTRIGCITGDMLGAMTEVTEAVLFLVVSTLG